MSRARLLIATALSALAATSTTALAQTQTAGEQATTMDDVVVTARRRSESLQSTPVAVTALGSEALDRQQVSDFKDLHLGIPNVTAVNNTGTTTGLQVYIRGVGQDDSSFTSESAVALYVDGVFIGRQIGGLTDLFDVDRVEVLRGPQGTLYGRNSSGGAIKYFTRRPDQDAAGAGARISLGSYDRLDVAGFANLPLIEDVLAVRLSAKSRHEDGFIDTINAAGTRTGTHQNAVDQQSLRASLLWTPSTDWEVFATYDRFQDSSGPQAISSTNCAGLNGALVQCPLRFGNPYVAVSQVPDINAHDQWGTQVTTDYTGLSFADVQFQTAYRTFEDNLSLDLSGNPGAPLALLQFLDQSQFSQEVLLTSKADGPFSWTVGGFYFSEDIDQDATFGVSRNVDTQESRSAAVFGEIRYEFGNGFAAFLGARYTEDEKTLRRAFASPAVNPLVNLGVGRFEDSQVTPRIGVEWQANPDLFFYATYGGGYKPGGFALARPGSAVGALGTFESETVDSYELGVRSSWFDDRLTANVTVFQTENKDLSQSILTATSFSVASGDAEIQGWEFESRLRVTDELNISFVGGLLDTEFTRRPPAAPPGARLKHAPESHFKLGFDFQRPLGTSGFSLYLAGNVANASDIFRNVANTVNIRSDAYSVYDAQIGVGPDDGAWKVTLAGQNLSDEEYWEQGVSTLGRYYARPRTFSITLDASF